MNTSAIYKHTGPGATKGDSAPNSRVARSTQVINTPPRRQIIHHNATPALFPSNISAPALSFNMPPVEGMVDLQTLIRIHAQLVQSNICDDNNLARFIEANYLPDNFNDKTEGGVQIQGNESFTKLYNAYKRVRNLTGRVQDKWPFFDRKWKTMNKNVVIKIAAGENAAPPSGSSASSTLEPLSVYKTAGNSLESPGGTAVQPQPHVPSVALEQKTVNQSKESSIKRNAALEVTPEFNTSTTPTKESPTLSSPAVNSSATPPRFTDGKNMAGNMYAGSSPGSVLAAEVEAVPEHSSLDELPMSSGPKRKRSPDFDVNERFAAGHQVINKRQRGGSRGGRGRGRKNTPLTVEHADLANDMNGHIPSTFDSVVSHRDIDTEIVDAAVKKPKTDPPSPRVTRRQKRLSGDNAAQTASTQPSSTQAALEKADTRKFRADSETTAIDEQNATAGQTNNGAATPDNDSGMNEPTEADLLCLGVSHFDGPQPSATALTQNDCDTDKLEPTATVKKQTNDPEVKTPEPGAVQIFARVNTGNTLFDIPLHGTSIDDKKLKNDLLRYAVWKQKMGEKSKSVEFDTWCSIYSIDR